MADAPDTTAALNGFPRRDGAGGHAWFRDSGKLTTAAGGVASRNMSTRRPGRGCCPRSAGPSAANCKASFKASRLFWDDFSSLANWTPVTVGNPAPPVTLTPEPGHPNAHSLASGAPFSAALLAFSPAQVNPSNPPSQRNFCACWQVRQALPPAVDQVTGLVLGMVDAGLQDVLGIGLDPGVSATNLILVWQSAGGPRTDVVTPFALDNNWHLIKLERVGQGPFVLSFDGVRFVAAATLGPGVVPSQPLMVGLGALGISQVADARVDHFSLAL